MSELLPCWRCAAPGKCTTSGVPSPDSKNYAINIWHCSRECGARAFSAEEWNDNAAGTHELRKRIAKLEAEVERFKNIARAEMDVRKLVLAQNRAESALVLAAYDKRLDELTAENASLREENKELRSILDNHEAHKLLTNEIARLQDENRNLKDDLRSANDAHASAEFALIDMKKYAYRVGHKEECFTLGQELKAARDEVESLKDELERERVRLAGCGVAAMQNTEESRKRRILPETWAWSASYSDVCRAVDREIDLRNENTRLRELVLLAKEHIGCSCMDCELAANACREEMKRW